MKLLLYSLSDGTHIMSFMPVYMFLIPKLFILCKCMYDLCIQGLQGEQYSGTDEVPV